MSDKHATAPRDRAAAAVRAHPSGPPGTPQLSVGRLADIWRREGAKGLWFRALARLGYRRWHRYVRPLAEPATAGPPGVPIEIVTLEAAGAAEYVALRADATEAEYRQRRRAGQACWAARHSGRLAAVKWVRCDAIEVPYLRRAFPLAPGEIYLHDMYTSPQLRGRHVQSVLSAGIFAHYRARGYDRAVALVSPANRSSIASMTRTGYRRSGWASLWQLGPLRWERLHR